MRLKVLLLALVLAICFAGVFMPAAKAEAPAVTPYANVLMWTGVTIYDKYNSGKTDDTGKAVGDTDLIMGITPQGSVGVRGTVNNVFADFCIMARTPFGSTGSEQSQTYMFIGAIMYKVGEVNITIGRHFTPYDILAFNDVACQGTLGGWDCLLGYSLFDATRDQIRINVSGFYVGLFKNTKNEDGDYDVLIPMIAAGYEYGNPGTPMHFSVHGLFQTYKIDDGMIDDDDDPVTPDVENPLYGKTINSYAGAAKFGMNMAPITFYVTGAYGINQADMGVQGGAATYEGDEVKNTSTMSGHAGVDYTMGAMKFGAGLGYKSIKYDTSGSDPDNAMSVYASLRYNVQPNFAVVPAVLYEDRMKDSAKNKEGKVIAIGVHIEAHI